MFLDKFSLVSKCLLFCFLEQEKYVHIFPSWITFLLIRYATKLIVGYFYSEMRTHPVLV